MNHRRPHPALLVAITVVVLVLVAVALGPGRGADDAAAPGNPPTTRPADSTGALVEQPDQDRTAGAIAGPTEDDEVDRQDEGDRQDEDDRHDTDIASRRAPRVAVPEVVEDQVEQAGEASVLVSLDVPADLADRAPEERAALVGAAVDELLAQLPEGSVTEVEPLDLIGGVAVRVDRAGLDALRVATPVEEISDDQLLRPFAEPDLDGLSAPTSATSAVSVGAPSAWAAGADGTGKVVAVLDTGVQSNHPYLSRGGASKVVAAACFSSPAVASLAPACPNGTTEQHGPGAADPCIGPAEGVGGCGHGTHVAGIAVGGRALPLPSGIAPGASLLAAQVFSVATGNVTCSGPPICLLARDSDVIRGLTWVYDQAATTPVVAVNLSLGGRLYTPGPACDRENALMKRAIDLLRTRGVVTVAASGNHYARGRISTPGCISTALAVGSADDDSPTLDVSPFSNHSSDIDLLAPGADITSSVPGSDPAYPGAMASMSGTSMASPAVTGALAVLAQARPGSTPPQLADLVLATGRPAAATCAPAVPYLSLTAALDPGALRPTLAPCSPFGVVDVVSAAPGSVTVAGWAIDPDTVDPVTVQVTVGGTRHTLTADGSRHDVGAAYRGYGDRHGFSAVLPAGAGPVTVCVQVANVGVGETASLGCRSVTVPSGSPFGHVDVVSAGTASVTVAGWAIDPDTSAPIPVHVYVGGAGYAITADGPRPDVGAAFPGYGSRHGYSAVLPAPGGSVDVCLYAINVGSGGNALLGCRRVAVPTGSPFGHVDVVSGGAGSVTVAGWAIDPDTSASIPVHVYVGGAGHAITADGSRPDVGAAFPGYGVRHGYSATLPAARGPATVCLYGINAGPGGNALLGCRTVTVP